MLYVYIMYKMITNVRGLTLIYHLQTTNNKLFCNIYQLLDFPHMVNELDMMGEIWVEVVMVMEMIIMLKIIYPR